MNEEWRDVVGQEGLYQVSDQGRVRSISRQYIDASGAKRNLKGRILKPKCKADGHTQVDLLGGMVHIHKLVLLAFVGPYPDGKMCLHLNHLPDDNRLSNLRYGTRRENSLADFRVGTRCHAGSKNPRAKLTEATAKEIRVSLRKTAELVSAYGVSRSTVQSVRAGDTWANAQ